MSEADDQLSHLVQHQFTAQDIAEHDQAMSAARTAASGLLSAYMTFHAAMDKGQLEVATGYHDQFGAIFKDMSRETAFLSLVTLCDWMSVMVTDLHGGWDGIIEAAKRGTLFGGRSTNGEAELLTAMEAQLGEQS
jgi:hypothetical protein